jgi:class 3 adenylate cyclase
MRVEIGVPCPLPEDPVLADIATAVLETEDFGLIVDASWRRVYSSDDERRSFAGNGDMAATVIGEHLFGPESVAVMSEARFAMNTPETWRSYFGGLGGMVLHDTPGGKQELRELVDPSLRDQVDELSPSDADVTGFRFKSFGLVAPQPMHCKALRIRDDRGALRGTFISYKLAAPMSILSAMAFERDADHLARMFSMSSARRRPGAMLFADLESSSALARRLSTSSYFALVRRLVRAADHCIVEGGGLVGRHVGDGVVAFFPVESYQSESQAALACIATAREIRGAIDEVTRRSELSADDVVIRFGLHWGATLFIGSITTSARAEVTALGDEANEAARIEACATGGRTLASKQLVERLDADDAARLAIDLDHLIYTQLADLPTATDKARRDAPAIAVCDVDARTPSA